MESLYPPRNNQETFDSQTHYQVINSDETRTETVGSILEQGSHHPAAPSAIRNITSSCYFMVHHNPVLWKEVQSRLIPIAEGDLEKGKRNEEMFIEAIDYFYNDTSFQTQHRRNQKKPAGFMLQNFFESLKEEKRTLYQEKLIPEIAKLVLDTEVLFPNDAPFPLLRQEMEGRIVFSKRQCACLLAHMVMCLTCDQKNDKLVELINFSGFYGKSKMEETIRIKIHKIKCIFTYYERFFQGDQEGEVVFERCSLKGDPTENKWKSCEKGLIQPEIQYQGGIEETQDALQVVFSDRKLGEDVLKLHTTQQQIMSLIHPELILSVLFCEELKDDEAVRVYGAGRYSDYEGYGDEFKFLGAHEDGVGKGPHVIINAGKYNLKQETSQFSEECVLRELNKAYVGFKCKKTAEIVWKRIATGRWGCGVFKGNPQLKFMIQWLAASRAGKEMIFCTFDDENDPIFRTEDLKKILEYYKGNSVRRLFEDLKEASREMQMQNEKEIDENKNLFKVLVSQLGL